MLASPKRLLVIARRPGERLADNGAIARGRCSVLPAIGAALDAEGHSRLAFGIPRLLEDAVGVGEGCIVAGESKSTRRREASTSYKYSGYFDISISVTWKRSSGLEAGQSVMGVPPGSGKSELLCGCSYGCSCFECCRTGSQS